ncbi:glycosyltransferase family 39 protein [Natronosporangium hydrolyticum]|uniref:Glycosyltransferase family 39 protein n=1 Tax=Natronosporangium hydrolyticum TaxID=2811111 RepID=A0A895YE28_9ACTN|nr:glycosyltransferase family 39 protein [Natronosporangium hydrolyticum]QSB12796.1 glycosyltransferase family 39 protein [Natronosporangium hydrolyticum]
MTDPDQTVVLPRQRDPVEETARPDAWQAPASGSAPVGGLTNAETALSRLAWLLTAVLMGLVGLIRTSWPSLSADSLTAASLSQLSWSELWLLRDQLPALDLPYFTLLRAWTQVFGHSEFALRFPSLLAMVVAAGATAALVSRMVGPRAGGLAGLLFVAVPATSRWAHEVAPHALTLALAVVATLLLVRIFDRPRFWRFAGYFLAVGLLGLSNGVALLVVLGHGVTVLALRRGVLTGWAAAAALGALPAAGLFFVGRAPWRPSLFDDGSGLPLVTEIAVTFFGVSVIAGAVAALAALAISMKKPAGVLTTAALVPLLGFFPAMSFWQLGAAQALLFSLPFWVSLAAVALHRVPLVRGLLVVLLIAGVGVPAQLAIRAADGHGLGGREVADVLHRHGEPDDAIIFGPDRADERVGRDLLTWYVLDPARPADVLALNPPRSGGELLAQECREVAECAAAAPRVWLLRLDTEPDPLTNLPAAKADLLRLQYDHTRSWAFEGASLALFTLAADEPDDEATDE